MKKNRTILVTSALPYANGNLHIGHILEFIQADIWARYHRQIGNKCVYISGIDAHGTPIMLNARNNKVSPYVLANVYKLSHISDLNSFFISIDNYYTTHSKENFNLSRNVFNKLYSMGYIYKKKLFQYYDSFAGIFLPDRYIKGSCPKCSAINQYGDFCDVCNFKYDSIDLVNPVSVISGSKPIIKETLHYFFSLTKFTLFLNKWCNQNITQKQIMNKLNEWFKIGLKDWNISRDYPYFGIKIPNEDLKYLYVWLDAPFGYISIAENFFSFLNDNFYDYYFLDNLELYHFIGKDIVYFHTLFWPAMLYGTNCKLPNDIFIHGFLTVNGNKMSKSLNNFITARDYLSRFEPEFLRYYYASKFNDGINDLDFNLSDFMNKINSDLIGKFLNIFSRSLKFLSKYSNNLYYKLDEILLFDKLIGLENYIKILYEKRMYSKIIAIIIFFSNEVNLYLDQKKPWLLKNNSKDISKALEICTTCVNLFLLLMVNIKPILPNLAMKVEDILCIKKPLDWENFRFPLLNSEFKNFSILLKKITLFDIDSLFK